MARYLVALRLAIDSIRAHKLRSFLTLLGVIIGVSSVVLVGSAIEGLSAYADESTSKIFGSNSYLVAQIAVAGRVSRKEIADKLKRNKRIRDEDLEYLRETTGDRIVYTSMRQKTDDIKNSSGQVFEDASILGASAAIPEIRDVTLVDGRFFTEQEEKQRQYLAVIGDDIRTQFFPGRSPLGRTIKINGIDFQVIGLQERLGSAFGRTQDNSVYIPASVFGRLYGPGTNITVFGKARKESGLGMEDALDVTRVALRTRFHAAPGKADNFDTLTPDAIRSFIDSLLAMISAVIVPVTCISLVVGGIVIMNIMLVSVTERTREIGVRKSLGAKRSDILLQFLIEATLMAAFGGAIGLALGAALTGVLSAVFQIRLQVTAFYAVLAIFVSGMVGIVSGWYPASRASKLDPVEALRAE